MSESDFFFSYSGLSNENAQYIFEGSDLDVKMIFLEHHNFCFLFHDAGISHAPLHLICDWFS